MVTGEQVAEEYRVKETPSEDATVSNYRVLTHRYCPYCGKKIKEKKEQG